MVVALWFSDVNLSSLQFPYCDGSHKKHNKDTGDNVGPLIVEQKKKEEEEEESTSKEGGQQEE